MEKINILMVAAEAAPYVKVGGLGDVVGSLPPALRKLGLDVRLILPLYDAIDRKKFALRKIFSNLAIAYAAQTYRVNLYATFFPAGRTPVYFLDAPEFFSGPEIYPRQGQSDRFLFFSAAVLSVLPSINFSPDIIHCHDAQTGLVPVLMKTIGAGRFEGVKTVFTIHNFTYQKKTSPAVLKKINLDIQTCHSLALDARDGDINFMVQGILNADQVTTVSPTYAREITTSFYGAGLEKIIRRRRADLTGIINGLDLDFFNPARDPFLVRRYSARCLSAKKENKLAVQKAFGLPVDEKIALSALVSRLVWQKGIDLLDEKCARLPGQLIILGRGEQDQEKRLKALTRRFPKQISVQIKYDEKLAHLVYAGADIFLMPSRFEPCGLGQMIAMRYGAVPVVRATGGLKDTVSRQTGFVFQDMKQPAFFGAWQKALDIFYQQPRQWRRRQSAGFRKDFSWTKPARSYAFLYRHLLDRRTKKN